MYGLDICLKMIIYDCDVSSNLQISMRLNAK